eukprot:TRINITY_DN13953_c0_g1_i1.p2 TRINITY_DN13953_c0_g1~~TRINITY_DN13953_c0_g1_i1.p2  ORF type:complete len:207 (+),score=10.34 TRINITY_DN13953_c0_g1_i1:100-720(+)
MDRARCRLLSVFRPRWAAMTALSAGARRMGVARVVGSADAGPLGAAELELGAASLSVGQADSGSLLSKKAGRGSLWAAAPVTAKTGRGYCKAPRGCASSAGATRTSPARGSAVAAVSDAGVLLGSSSPVRGGARLWSPKHVQFARRAVRRARKEASRALARLAELKREHRSPAAPAAAPAGKRKRQVKVAARQLARRVAAVTSQDE